MVTNTPYPTRPPFKLSFWGTPFDKLRTAPQSPRQGGLCPPCTLAPVLTPEP